MDLSFDHSVPHCISLSISFTQPIAYLLSQHLSSPTLLPPTLRTFAAYHSSSFFSLPGSNARPPFTCPPQPPPSASLPDGPASPAQTWSWSTAPVSEDQPNRLPDGRHPVTGLQSSRASSLLASLRRRRCQPSPAAGRLAVSPRLWPAPARLAAPAAPPLPRAALHSPARGQRRAERPWMAAMAAMPVVWGPWAAVEAARDEAESGQRRVLLPAPDGQVPTGLPSVRAAVVLGAGLASP